MIFITDHVARGIERLPEQYKGKEKIEGFVSALLAEAQNLENTFEDLQLNRSIETAVGDALDRLGVIVGLARLPGQTDTTYRSFLKVKIIQNLNQGTPEEVIAAAQFFLNAVSVWYLEVYPAAVDILTTAAVPLADRPRVRAQIKDFLPAGVSLDVFGQYDETNPFIFDGGQGFGDVANPSIGGLLADAY